GVDQGGLARSDVACEQSVAAIDFEGPDSVVEGAPVVDLETVQPTPWASEITPLALRCPCEETELRLHPQLLSQRGRRWCREQRWSPSHRQCQGRRRGWCPHQLRQRRRGRRGGAGRT